MNRDYNYKKNPLRVSVIRKGLYASYFHKNYFSDIYHLVLATSWVEFFAINSFLYILLNVLFAGLYCIGGENILNATPNSFWDAFVFSFQTSTTIGYGYLLPANVYADIIVILDTLSGIIFVPIVTGLTFAKITRPTARVIFTRNCVIHNFQGMKTFMFRMANARDSHIADASVKAVVLFSDKSQEGLAMERVFDLKLTLSRSPIFLTSWTVMHTIDADSPLAGMTPRDFEEKNVRIIISLTGIDDWSSRTVHASYIFFHQDVVYDQKFVDVLSENGDGSILMDYSKLHELEPFQP